jgi:hypothetical protein
MSKVETYINRMLFAVEILALSIYCFYFFADEGIDDNLRFLDDISREFKDESLKSTYMKEFGKAFPHKEKDGLVGTNWFSKILDFTFIPIFFLICFSVATFNFFSSSNSIDNIGRMKNATLSFIFALILLCILFINNFFYTDEVYIPDKDIYIFSSEVNSKIEKRLAKIKANKFVYIADNLFLFLIVCVHLIFALVVTSYVKEKGDELLINNSTKEKKAQALAPIN